MKKIIEIKNKLSSPGRINKKNTFSTFVIIPEYPFPSIIAPIYFPGRIPPSPKTVAYVEPMKQPNTSKRAKHAQKDAAVSVIIWAKSGKIIIMIASLTKAI